MKKGLRPLGITLYLCMVFCIYGERPIDLCLRQIRIQHECEVRGETDTVACLVVHLFSPLSREGAVAGVMLVCLDMGEMDRVCLVRPNAQTIG